MMWKWSSGPRFPAPDERRCVAIAKDTGRRCNHYANWWRDGRHVCARHYGNGGKGYTTGDLVAEFERVMAQALGDT